MRLSAIQVFDVIDAEKRRIGGLFGALETCPPRERTAWGALVAHALRLHLRATRETLYTVMRQHDGTPAALDDCRAEQEAIGAALDAFEALPSHDASWADRLAALRTEVEGHFRHEGEALVPIARRQLDPRQAEHLASAMRTFERVAEHSAGSGSRC